MLIFNVSQSAFAECLQFVMNFMSILVVFQQIIRPGFHKYFSGHVPIQHFERWACTSKIFYDKETEQKNKNMFTNKHVNIF